jgi:hypothetical protein
MFEAPARLLLPDGELPGRTVEADERWTVDGELPADVDALVWGREPVTAGAGARTLTRTAVRRERALARLTVRPPKPLRVRAVHRWPPTIFRASRLSGLRAAGASGALVELTRGAPCRRVVDSAASAAGARGPARSLYPGTEGSLLGRIATPDGRPLVLRVGEAGGPADPRHGIAALERLARSRLSVVPSPAGHGRVADAAWSAEAALPGRRPGQAGRSLASQVLDLCLRLPIGEEPPSAFSADLDEIEARLPVARESLGRLRVMVGPVVGSLPSVLRHGDLWAGNLLVDRGALRGVVDWDAWHPAAVPGTDLLHLLAMQEAVRSGRSIGEVWLGRPWDSAAFRELTDRYWRVLGVHPDRDVREAVGVAWWANQVAFSLARLPSLATDERWLARNVWLVLQALDDPGLRCAS